MSIFLPNLPSHVGESDIPKLGVSISALCSFNKWQALGWMRFLYYLSLLLNVIFWVVIFVYNCASGDPALIIAAIFVVPILFVFWCILLRVLCEVLSAVLLMPVLLAGSKAQAHNAWGLSTDPNATEGVRPPAGPNSEHAPTVLGSIV